MKKPSRLAIVFNGAALLIVLTSGAAVLRSVFVADELAPCSTRYSQGTQLSLERSRGELLTSADLQARFGGTDWGLLDNARVVEVKDNGPRPAIEVRLAKVGGKAAPDDYRAGMGFTWTPRGVNGVASACLTYSLLMPSDFDFAKGGRLPGLLASAQAQSVAHVPSIRAGWREAGGLEVSAQLAGWSDPRALANDSRSYTLPRGQWVALEQEIVLNAPGQKDGAVRVWVDGALRFEKNGLVLRDSADIRITGVAAEALSYGAVPSREGKLWFSPLELRWQ